MLLNCECLLMIRSDNEGGPKIIGFVYTSREHLRKTTACVSTAFGVRKENLLLMVIECNSESIYVSMDYHALFVIVKRVTQEQAWAKAMATV